MTGIRHLLGDLRGSPRHLFAQASAVGVLVSVLEGASSWALLGLLAFLQYSAMPLMGGAGSGHGLPAFGGFAEALLAYIAISAALILAQWWFARGSARLASHYSTGLRGALLDSIGRAPWLAVRTIPAPDIGHALSAGSQQAGQAARNAVTILMQGGAVFAQLLVVGIVAPSVILPGIAVLALFAGIARLGRGSGAVLLSRLRGVFLQLHQRASDFGLGAKYFKANRLDGELGDRVRQDGASADQLNAGWSDYGAVRKAASTSFGAAVIAGMAVLAHGSSQLPFETLVAVAVITFRMLPALIGLQQGWHGLGQTADAVANIHTLVQRLAQPSGATVIAPALTAGTGRPTTELASPVGRPVAAVLGAEFMTLENVSVRYPGRAEPVGPFNLQIRKGEWLIVRGSSGSGKTTLLDLIAGAIPMDAPPCAGRVAYATQDPFFFHGTLHENLLLGAAPAAAHRNAAEDEIWQALDLCQIGATVRALPDRLQTRIDSRLSALSGGQRQRVALARAVLQRPDLLLLDEATNALDAPTESHILHGIRAAYPELSVILATHRAEALQFAHRTLELDNTRAGT